MIMTVIVHGIRRIVGNGFCVIIGILSLAACLQADVYVGGNRGGLVGWDSVAEGLPIYAFPGVSDSLGCGPPAGWAPPAGSTILGCSFESVDIGAPATPSYFRLTEVQLSVSPGGYGRDSLFDVALYSSTPGFPMEPVSRIATLANGVAAPANQQVTDINVANGPVLESGPSFLTYFIVLTPAEPFSLVTWNGRGPAVGGALGFGLLDFIHWHSRWQKRPGKSISQASSWWAG